MAAGRAAAGGGNDCGLVDIWCAHKLKKTYKSVMQTAKMEEDTFFAFSLSLSPPISSSSSSFFGAKPE